MNNILFKDLTVGSPVYALIKADSQLKYEEGTIVSIGQQRTEMPPMQPNAFPMPNNMPTTKAVVDVTYCVAGKNFTDAVEVTSYMFSTEKTGAITLVTTDKEPIIRELNATLKRSEDYLRNVETEVPKNKKRIEDCKALISQLDTKFAEKQEMENRIKSLEESNKKLGEGMAENNSLLKKLIEKFNGKQV